MSDRRITTFLVFLQLLIGAFALNQFPIALDEPFSIFQAQFPLGEMLSNISAGNNSPLHFIALHYWIKMFGIDAFAVRSFSLLISLVSVVYLYKIGRKFWKKEYAVLLVGFFIFSRLNHFVALEARMYGLFTLFFILILNDFYALLFEDKKTFIQLGIWNALLLYTHYLGGVIILMECLVFLFFFSKWTKQKIIYVLFTAIIGVVLFVPGIKTFLNRAEEFKTMGTWVPETQFVDLWTILVKLLNNQFTFFFTLFVLVLIAFFKMKNKKGNTQTTKLFFVYWFFGTYGLMFIISIWIQPIFFTKYVQFLTIPLFILIVDYSANNAFTGKFKMIPFVLIIPFMLSFKPIPDTNREMDVLMEYVVRNKTNQTLIYYCPEHHEASMAYFYDKDIFTDYKEMRELMKKEGFYSAYKVSDLKINDSVDYVLFIDYNTEVVFPNNGVLDALQSSYQFIESKEFKGSYKVYIFSVNAS